MKMEHTTRATTEHRHKLADRLSYELLQTPRRVLAYQDSDVAIVPIATSVMQLAFMRFLEINLRVEEVQVMDNYANREAWRMLAVRASFPAHRVRYLTPLNVAGDKTPIDLSLPLFANGDALTFDKNRALWKRMADSWPKLPNLYVSVPISDPRRSIHMIELVHHFDQAIYVYPENLTPSTAE